MKRDRYKPYLDWRDENMPCLFRVSRDKGATFKLEKVPQEAIRSYYEQKMARVDGNPDWYDDPTYELTKLKKRPNC